MRVRELMTNIVLSVGSDLEADRAWREMRRARIHHLVVIDDGRIRGILSDRDLGGEHGDSVRAGRLVRDLMTACVHFASPEMTTNEAARLMHAYKLSCLPVLDGKTLVGMLTTTDLIELLGRGVARVGDDREQRMLRDRGPDSRTFAVAGKNGLTRA